MTTPDSKPKADERSAPTHVIKLEGDVRLEDLKNLERILLVESASRPKKVLIDISRLGSIAAIAVRSCASFLRGLRRQRPDAEFSVRAQDERKGGSATSIVKQLCDHIPPTDPPAREP